MADGPKRLSLEERAQRLLAGMDYPRRDPADPQDSHALVFSAACALYWGFGLDEAEAFPLLRDYCRRSDRPWTEGELRHKLAGARTAASSKPRGYLLEQRAAIRSGVAVPTPTTGGEVSALEPINKVEFDAKKLSAMAAPWRDIVNLEWLANRSARDPAEMTSAGFLQAMYPNAMAGSERIICFTNQQSQGQAVWPTEKPPVGGPEGVWFLAQPVDGKYHPNPRQEDPRTKQPTLSRRSKESVLAFRYMLLESDQAEMRDWLGLLVQLPLRIEAIYTSGGRSIHALVRVDCPTKGAWDDEKRAMEPVLRLLGIGGADLRALSAVRLTRLPQAMRGDRLQKLLYLQPGAPLRALKDAPVTRNVVRFWCGLAALGVGDADEGAGAAWIRRGLDYYANVSAEVRAARANFEKAGGA